MKGLTITNRGAFVALFLTVWLLVFGGLTGVTLSETPAYNGPRMCTSHDEVGCPPESPIIRY